MVNLTESCGQQSMRRQMIGEAGDAEKAGIRGSKQYTGCEYGYKNGQETSDAGDIVCFR